MTFFSALYTTTGNQHRKHDVLVATLPVQVVPSGERRATCGKLRLFGETFDEQTGYRRGLRFRLRRDLALFVLVLFSGHCNRLLEGKDTRCGIESALF